ncbi:MAG: site-specific DNA-methyltransferase [Janthinobacterium sp.]|jgi:site-specific DNA-methyltransferase (adenine-specific)
MDNLALLPQIPDCSIDLIYNDVLFNTGKRFSDFDDGIGTTEQALKFYRSRLIEMQRVLKPTGSIYIHCDFRLSHYLKIEMDKLFRFRNEIIWCYRQSGRGSKSFANKHDTIFFYTKSDRYTFNDNDIRVPYEGSGGYQTSGRGVQGKNGRIYYPNPVGKIPEDWWDIPALTPMSKERVGYDTQKPKALLERIIKASSNVGDVVADFFIGSGTSLVVAKNLGRDYIGCDISTKAVGITNRRMTNLPSA